MGACEKIKIQCLLFSILLVKKWPKKKEGRLIMWTAVLELELELELNIRLECGRMKFEI